MKVVVDRRVFLAKIEGVTLGDCWQRASGGNMRTNHTRKFYCVHCMSGRSLFRAHRPRTLAVYMTTCLLVAALFGVSASAATIVWDTNGTTAGSGAATGTWGSSAFWSTDLTGSSATTATATNSIYDTVFSAGTNGTGGTITISDTQAASSILMDDNVALTFSGGTSLTVGGTGAYSGIFVAKGDDQANTISTALVLGADSTFQNGGTGTLTISGGVTSPATANLVLANNNTTGNGITISGSSLNNTGTVTNFGWGSGSTLISAVIGTNVTGVIQNSTSSGLSLTAANLYTGATSINSGTLTLSGAGQINASTAINFNGGTLTLTNTTAGEGSTDRIKNDATITSNGGTLNYNNSLNVAAAETVGSVALSTGLFNVSLAPNNTTAIEQLTFGGLTQSGTGSVAFSNPSKVAAGFTSFNVVTVTSSGTTTGGQIIGPWATIGTWTGNQSDYAVYSSNNIAAANIATSLEGTWTGGATGNYTTTATANTITAARTMNSWRYNIGAGALTLNQFTFDTNGILNGGTGLLTVSGTSGALRQQGTAAGSVYLNTGSAAITVSANIQDNTGALTLVKNGIGGNLILSGRNTFTGGLVINAGNVQMGGTNSNFSTSFGTGTTVISGGGSIDSNTANTFNLNNNALTVNGDFTGAVAQNIYFGNGAVSLGSVSGLTRTITATNMFTLAGVISDGAGSNSITKAGAGNLVLSGANLYTGKTILTAGNLMIGVNSVGSVGAITSSAIGTGPLILSGGGISSDSIAARTILNPVTFTPTANTTTNTFGSNTNNAVGKLTFSAPVDLGLGVMTLALNSDVQFDGVVSGPSASLVKTGVGMLTLNNTETYGGATSIAQGTLKLGTSGVLPTGTNVTVSGYGGGVGNQTSVLDLNGTSVTIGTLTLQSAITVAGTAQSPNASGFALVTTGAGTLTLGGDLTYSATNNPFSAIVAGNLALGSVSRNFAVTNSAVAQSTPDLIVSANISGGSGVNLTLNGAGTVLFSGNNSYAGSTSLTAGGTLFISGNNTTTGATSITSGTLIARSANALGGSGNTAGVTVAASQNLTYNALTDGQLAIGGALSFAGAGTLGASIGSDLTTDAINVTGNATTTASAITVNIFGNSLSRTTGGSGDYTLIAGGGSSSLNNATYSLGTIYNNTNFTVNSTLTKTATDLKASVTNATALTTAYWKGTGTTNATIWSASSNGAVQSNWTSDAGGTTITTVVPGATTDVFFSATGATAPTTTTLGSDMTIKSLTQISANAMTVNADGYMLTVTPSASTTGITLNGAALTFNANLALGAAQTWTNNSGATFTINGNVVNGSNNLTVTGANQTTIVGTFGGLPGNAGGSGSITKNSNGTLILQGYNTFTGGITVNQGTVQFENPNAFGTGTLTLNQSAVINSNFGNLINANNNAVTINGDFTFTGSQALNLGTGAVTLGSTNDPTPTFTVNTNPLTFNGVISNGTSANGLAKFGNNVLILGGANTYTGATTITQNTLRIGTSNAINTANTVAVNGTNNNAATFDLNGFNQSLANLTFTGAPTAANGSVPTVTNTNIAGSSTLTLTGGANAFTVYPVQGFALGQPVVSVNKIDLNNATQTFYIGGNLQNSLVSVSSIIQNGALTKAGLGGLTLTGANTYAGATSIYGGNITLNGNLGAINSATGGIALNGGTLTLTNANNQNLVNRVADAAAISSYGGNISFANTIGAGVVYSETLGTVTLNNGQLDMVLSTDQTSGVGNKQTLALGALTQNGTTNITFSAAGTGLGNAAIPSLTNIITSGSATTTAGNIIGPWATTGLTAAAQSDYAVYNVGQVVAANITANNTENTWASAANINIGSGPTLTATRTLNSLRASAASQTVTQNQFNLETLGLLQGSTGIFTINATSGVLRQPGTSAANMYLNTGSGAMTINANIADNGAGALTLVKTGTGGNLILNGLNTFTGGVVVNAGNLQAGATNSLFTTALGTGTVVMSGGALDSNTAGMTNLNNNALTINGDFTFTGTQSLNFGTGAVSLGTAPGFSRKISTNSNPFTLGGVISNGTTVNSLTKAGAGNLFLSGANTYTGDTYIANGFIQIGVGNVGSVGSITSSAIGTGRINFINDGSTVGGLASDSAAARTILNPVVFNNNALFGNAANNGIGKLTFSDGVNLGFVPRTMTLASDVDFNGVVTGSGGVAGGGIVKTGPGTLTLNAANTYGGPTAVVQGTLKTTAAGALPYLTNVYVASLSANQTAVLDLGGNSTTIGTLTMGGFGNTMSMAGTSVYVGGGNVNSSATGSALVATGAGTLTLGGDLTYATNNNGFTSAITGNLNLGSLNLTQTALGITRAFTIGDSTGANAAPDMAISAVISGPAGVGINKTGAGILLLSGNNTYSGQTILNGGSMFITGNNSTTGLTTLTSGTVIARSANALGGSGNRAGVTVAASQNLTYNALTDAALAIGGNLSYAGAGTLGASIGSNFTTDAINVTGNATTTASAITVNIFGNSLSRTVGGTGDYTLIAGGGSSTLNNATYTLGTIYNNTNFTVSSTLTKTATDLKATVTNATALTTAYWKGTGTTNATIWSASSNGAVQSNWATTLAGTTISAVVPGPSTDVFFSATGTTSIATSTLGADMAIQSLTQQSGAAMTVNADGYTLTITPDVGTKGINLLAQAALTFNANLVAGANQTWSNTSAATFTVNGNVNLGANALTVTGANAVTIVGAISGSGGSITKNGTGGILNLSGNNTFTGGVTINQGTVQLGNPTALGTGTLTFSGAGATIDSSFGNLINANNNAVALNADFTFTGTQALNLGTGNVTLGTASTATSTTRTITVNTNPLTLGGVIANSGTTTGLAKAGNNTLLLNGQNTYTGLTSVTNATLRIGQSNAIASGNAMTLFGVGGTPIFDLNGFNQNLGSLTMSALFNNGTSTVTNLNVASPSTLTLSGGATAFVFTQVNTSNNPSTATISVNTVNLNGAATFNIADGSGNPDLNITSVVTNGSLTKTNNGQMA
ncbi:MAG: hypothetical protein CK530_06615, partial [Planctomycetaceae bacterium]